MTKGMRSLMSFCTNGMMLSTSVLRAKRWGSHNKLPNSHKALGVVPLVPRPNLLRVPAIPSEAFLTIQQTESCVSSNLARQSLWAAWAFCDLNFVECLFYVVYVFLADKSRGLERSVEFSGLVYSSLSKVESQSWRQAQRAIRFRSPATSTASVPGFGWWRTFLIHALLW